MTVLSHDPRIAPDPAEDVEPSRAHLGASVQVGDEDLARAVGQPIDTIRDDPLDRLSPRERDVYRPAVPGALQIAKSPRLSSSASRPSRSTSITSTTSSVPDPEPHLRFRRHSAGPTHATSATDGSGRDASSIGALRERSEVGSPCDAVVLVSAGENRLKRRDSGRVELAVDRLRESEPRDSARHRVAVRAIRSHCVVGVGDGDESEKPAGCPRPPSRRDSPGRRSFRDDDERSWRSPSTRRRARGCARRWPNAPASGGARRASGLRASPIDPVEARSFRCRAPARTDMRVPVSLREDPSAERCRASR